MGVAFACPDVGSETARAYMDALTGLPLYRALLVSLRAPGCESKEQPGGVRSLFVLGTQLGADSGQ